MASVTGPKHVSFSLYPNPNELLATKENLHKAIKEKKKQVLDCHFVAGYISYAPFEYAVFLQDIEALNDLYAFSHSLDSPLAEGSLLHFYMSCLKEHSRPNLPLLHWILDRTPDLNTLNADRLTSIELAMQYMGSYSRMHFDVASTLLQRNVRLDNRFGSTPFTILRDRALLQLTYLDQLKCLWNLANYAKLEDESHMRQPSSYLSLEEFKRGSSCLLGEIKQKFYESNLARSLCVQASYSSLDDEAKNQTTQNFLFMNQESNYLVLMHLTNLLLTFQILVADQAFSNYFDDGFCNTIRSFLNHQKPQEPELIQKLQSAL